MARIMATPLAGRRFGALVAVARQGQSGKNAAWLCACDCGQQAVVRSDRLLLGLKRACGVNGHKFIVPRLPTIQSRNIREARSWRGMHERCSNPKNSNYRNYGGRGVSICKRWADFENFLKDMGPKPTPWHSIERKNVNGHYTPRNCIWATRKAQTRNRRDTVFVRYGGKKVRFADLVEQLGLTRSVVYGRLKIGWSLADAIGVPVRGHKAQNKVTTLVDKT